MKKTRSFKTGSNSKSAPQQARTRARVGGARRRFVPQEFTLVALRDCPFRDGTPLLDTPERAAQYWREHVATEARFNPHAESLVLLMVNLRRRLLGHLVLSQGTKDTLLVNHSEALRPAVLAGAAAVVLMHNHPSGEASPSESDIKVTRQLQQAGDLLNVQVIDHVIMGKPSRKSARDFVSLKELGYFEKVPAATEQKAAEGGRRVGTCRRRRAGRAAAESPPPGGPGSVTLWFHLKDGAGGFSCEVSQALYQAMEKGAAARGVSLQTFVMEAVREHCGKGGRS